MSHDSKQRSVYESKPAEFYHFSTPGLNFYRTNSPLPLQTFQNSTYESTAISKTSTEETQDITKSEIVITLPDSDPIADLWKIQPPSQTVSVTVYERDFGEPDTEYAVSWKGRVSNCVWEENQQGGVIKLTCESIINILKTVTLGRKYQISCPNTLYDNNCKVNKSLFELNGTVTALSGVDVTVVEAFNVGVNYYAGGYIEWTAPNGTTETKFIERNDINGVMTLDSLPLTLTISTAVKVFPGCDQTLDTCASKFNNHLNYWGFPFFGIVDPFNGGLLF